MLRSWVIVGCVAFLGAACGADESGDTPTPGEDVGNPTPDVEVGDAVGTDNGGPTVDVPVVPPDTPVVDDTVNTPDDGTTTEDTTEDTTPDEIQVDATDVPEPPDAMVTDAVDASDPDSASDVSVGDTEPGDAPTDAGPGDAEPVDAQPLDVTPGDTATVDAAPSDATQDTATPTDTVFKDVPVGDVPASDVTPDVAPDAAPDAAADADALDCCGSCYENFLCNPITCFCDPIKEDGPCTPFLEGACTAGQWCKPADGPPIEGALQGLCVNETGDAPQGAPCGNGIAECGPGLDCLLSGGEFICLAFCDPNAVSGDGICDEGSICLQLPLQDGAGNTIGFTPYGNCFESCNPWAQADSGCEEGEACSPYIYNAKGGSCALDDGLAGPGDPCGVPAPETTCKGGLICLGTALGPTCSKLCYPDANPGEPGDVCDETESCGGLQNGNPDGTNVQLDIGACLPGCDFHLEVACTDEALSCAPGEIFGNDDDVCLAPNAGYDPWPLDEFAPCPATANPGELCGPNQVCLSNLSLGTEGAGTLFCYDLCILSEGPFFQSNHPDCRRDTAVCDPMFGIEQEFGLCGLDG